MAWDDSGKRHTENVLLSLLKDLLHLFLSDSVTPHLWNRVKITPLHKKGPTTSPKNYRLLAINGCIYRLFATWSGTCWQTGLLLNIKNQTLNLVSAPQGTPTNPSLFFATFSQLLKGKKEGIHSFPGPLCCLRQCSKREALETLAKN